MTVAELIEELSMVDPQLDVEVFCGATDYDNPVNGDLVEVEVVRRDQYRDEGTVSVNVLVLTGR